MTKLENDIIFISKPQSFEGGEEEYDLSIGGSDRTDLLKCGKGAFRLASHFTKRPIQRLAEIGAGGGTCSLGIIEAAKDAEILITDTSPDFLRIIQRKLAANDFDHINVKFATLAGEDLLKLGTSSYDAIIIASALHHVSDWKKCIQDARQVIAPGGVLVIQEPFKEGNLFMGIALDIMLSSLWPHPIPENDAIRLRNCRASIYEMADSTLEKLGEDKHTFSVLDLIRTGFDANFENIQFYQNQHFEDLSQGELNERCTSSLVSYFSSFLKFHHNISSETLATLESSLYPITSNIEALFKKGEGLPIMGSIVLC